MRVAIVGTYPPRACGIATFTSDVERALLLDHRIDEVDVISVGKLEDGPQCTIERDEPASYAAAAARANRSQVVLLQHEFGIFGGTSGSYVSELVDALRVPLVVTLHTVVPRYTPSQLEVVRHLCAEAAAVTVFTESARTLLASQGVRSDHVQVVAHGAPVELFRRPGGDRARLARGWGERRVVSTFGLLSEGKGIDLAIAAMSKVAEDCPEALYVVAGRTHPEIVRREGEQYRERLQQEVSERGLGEHVVFFDRFLPTSEIAEILAATHVFCTPYRGADQIVSGALTFAVAAGCPVVATPYRYACDLLADGAGAIVPFDQPQAMGEGLLGLLIDGPARDAACAAAAAAGASLQWPNVGHRLADVLTAACPADRTFMLRIAAKHVPLAPSVAHLRDLVDDTSILQHADGAVPRLEHGYCVDDTARLLPLSAAYAVTDPAWDVVTVRALSFLRAAVSSSPPEPPGMRNFCSWERAWLDEPHGGDHVGRAMWGLGEFLAAQTRFAEPAARIAGKVLDGLLAEDQWLRTVAYATLGLAAWDGRPARAQTALGSFVDGLKDSCSVKGGESWPWPEPMMTYDNARIPEALLRGGAALGDARAVSLGLELLGWYDALCLTNGGYYRFPGNEWITAASDIGRSGAEQPLEASAMLDAHAAAFEVTGERRHIDAADRSLRWFTGANASGLSVADPSTGGCGDGLGVDGVSPNQGAESTLAFHRACLVHRRLLQSVAGRRSTSLATAS